MTNGEKFFETFGREINVDFTAGGFIDDIDEHVPECWWDMEYDEDKPAVETEITVKDTAIEVATKLIYETQSSPRFLKQIAQHLLVYCEHAEDMNDTF